MHIFHDFPLKTCHTFAIDVRGKCLVEIWDEEDVKLLHPYLTDKYMIIGEGSNILFTDHFFGNILIYKKKEISKIEEDAQKVILKVAAGETWDNLVEYCIKNSYYGIENLSGIPGTVGAAPVQNIGAYGTEAKDVILQVEGYFLDSFQKHHFSFQECDFAYRSSIFKTKFKNRFLVTSVYLSLSKIEKYNLLYAGLSDILYSKKEPLSLQIVRDAVLSLRNTKLPDVKKIGSAGSFFKNPVILKCQYVDLLQLYPNLKIFPTDEGKVKLSAAQLIEMCGWKGFRQGDAGVYPQQALVLVNYGHAGGKEVEQLSKDIQQSVYQKFNINLEPEVLIL